MCPEVGVAINIFCPKSMRKEHALCTGKQNGGGFGYLGPLLTKPTKRKKAISITTAFQSKAQRRQHNITHCYVHKIPLTCEQFLP